VDEMMPLMPFWAESIADSLIMAAVSSVSRPGHKQSFQTIALHTSDIRIKKDVVHVELLLKARSHRE
jgi:hypothetical protein